jgi:hypothetical protein
VKLAFYTATRPGVQGLFNRLIRWRFQGQVSHCEIVFEPADRVDEAMPDGSTAPDGSGALWCVSAVAWERLPAWSKYRPNKRGGVRFKRVALDPAKWVVLDANWACPSEAAFWATKHEGEPYSWRLIARFIAWLVELATDGKQWVCSQACAVMLEYAEPWRFDPCVLFVAAKAQQEVPE